jgi:glutathione S-transferase
MASSKDLSTPFTLYAFQFSVRSIMIQLAYEMRGAPKAGHPDMILQRHYVNISPDGGDQLTESYLCTINPKGAVPVLANERVLDKPMAETVPISWYLCDWYPSLLPKEHEGAIRELIEELHAINYHVLTFGLKSPIKAACLARGQEILAKTDVSAEYRRALEAKLDRFVPRYLSKTGSLVAVCSLGLPVYTTRTRKASKKLRSARSPSSPRLWI